MGVKKIFLIAIVSFAIINITYGQISLTGKEHLINSYSLTFGKNVNFYLNEGDVNNLFVKDKNGKLKKITKFYDIFEVNNTFLGSENFLVKSFFEVKGKKYLLISKKNNVDIYLLLDEVDYTLRMRNYSVYDSLLDSLKKNNIYIQKNFIEKSFSKINNDQYLLCDKVYEVSWHGYNILNNDSVTFDFSIVCNKGQKEIGNYSLCASQIVNSIFEKPKTIETCLREEQARKDIQEDYKLHAFILDYISGYTKPDTVYFFSSSNGWHHNELYEFYSESIQKRTFSPDSTYSKMEFQEFVKYIDRRRSEGYEIRMELARKADSVNSIGYMSSLIMNRLNEAESNKDNSLVAKPRVDDSKKKFLSKSPIVTNIKEWNYSYSKGKWINEKPSAGDRGCKSLQLCSFSYNGEMYYVLKITVRGGEYKYPVLHMDFIPYDEYYLIIFSDKEIINLKTPNDIAKVIPSYMEHYENYNQKYTDNMVVRWLEDKVDHPSEYYIWVQKYDKYIRYNFSIVSSYDRFHKNNPSEGIKYEVNDHYFEVPLSEWTKLFTIVK